MQYKSLIYLTKFGKDSGRWAYTEAENFEEAVKKFDALACHLCHGKKEAVAYTKPIAL